MRKNGPYPVPLKMLSNTHFLTDFQKLNCRRKMRTRAKSFVLWKKWVTKWLRCLKSPQKLLRAFWQRSRHPIKKRKSKTFRKWGDELLCQISGFYLNIYYLLSNRSLKIVFWTWRGVRPLYQKKKTVIPQVFLISFREKKVYQNRPARSMRLVGVVKGRHINVSGPV